MGLTSRQAAAIAHRKRDERVARDLALEAGRLRVAIGDELVDVVWSNAECAAFCLRCADVAPAPTVKYGAERGTPCACCHEPVENALREGDDDA